MQLFHNQLGLEFLRISVSFSIWATVVVFTNAKEFTGLFHLFAQ